MYIKQRRYAKLHKLQGQTYEIYYEALRAIEHRLKHETIILENQLGFMPRRSTMKAIYLLRRLIERH